MAIIQNKSVLVLVNFKVKFHGFGVLVNEGVGLKDKVDEDGTKVEVAGLLGVDVGRSCWMNTAGAQPIRPSDS